jgi:hypothetical protein
VPDIFDEVAQDLRAERTRRFFTRYGIAGAGGYEAWTTYQGKAALRVSDEYLAAVRIADGPQAERGPAIAAFERVAAEAGPGYRTLARLRAAALKADAGDLAGASALWDSVAGDGGADPLLRDLATLTWALHHVDTGEPAQVEARLNSLAAPDNAWHPLAEEAQAVLALRQGKTDAARNLLKQLAQDVTAPNGLRGRANGLLSRIGG